MAEDPSRSHVGQRLDALWLCALYKRSLLIRCAACPHRVVVAAAPVWWRFKRAGWPEALRDVPPRFYCRACWGRSIRKVRPRVVVTLDPPTDNLSLAWPDEREWKRMVSRYRS